MARSLLVAALLLAVAGLPSYSAAARLSPNNHNPDSHTNDMSPRDPLPPPQVLAAMPRGLMSDADLSASPFYRPLWEQHQSLHSQRVEQRRALLAMSLEDAALSSIPGVVTMKAPVSQGADPMVDYTLLAKYGVTARLATIRNPVGHFHVYSIDSATGACGGILALTSVIARTYKCTYATNGGPFDTVPGATRCLGAVVSDGVVTNGIPLPSGAAAFALSKGGEWTMGLGLNTSAYGAMEELITGFGWLVYKGQSVVSTAGGLVAPRTTIGVNSKGELLSFVAEGSETAFSGLTLQQAAEWMVELGMVHAINLDGGGSSASWWPANSGNHVIGTQGCPTCIDIPFCCERSVETITCVK